MKVKKESGFSASSAMADLLASSKSQIPALKRGQEVVGKVVAVSNSEILVDIGAKSEGIIAGRELSSGRDIVAKVQVGDSIEATVMYPENDAGQVVLSLRKLSGEKRWQELEERKAGGEEIDVVAMEANRGGIICDFAGLRGFLPASQLSTRSTSSGQAVPSKLDDLVGKNMQVRVIEVDRPSNRLIFSQKSPGKGDLADVLALLAKVKIGDKYEGVVSAILPFGIFVEIKLEGSKVAKVSKVSKGDNKTFETSETSDTSVPSKLEGLVHISEISWEKIDNPAAIYKVGDKVEVLVIAKDAATGRLNLSIKQLGEDPFARLSEKYTKDMKVSGMVSKVTPFGVFVTLEDPSTSSGPSGIEGLVHISKIPPNVEFKEGQKIQCEIDSVDVPSRKIALVPIVTQKPVLYR